MKVVLLAGGFGTRLSEETTLRPKPMIEIGGRPMLWHIMNIYAHHGVTDFIVALGYRGHMIKEYFANYVLYSSDVTVDTGRGEIHYHRNYAEPWRVTLVDTGADTQTGGRLTRLSRYLDGEEAFCMTYGDGVADVDVSALVAFHRAHGRKATVTAVIPPGRYGALVMEGDQVRAFTEKPPGDTAAAARLGTRRRRACRKRGASTLPGRKWIDSWPRKVWRRICSINWPIIIAMLFSLSVWAAAIWALYHGFKGWD
jgi:glucose-1-phosphate cytidylyltransferase